MEIETKIFDIKKVRKVLEKKEITPKRICDVTDFLFDITDFSPEDWHYALPSGKKSGLLVFWNVSVEIPDTDALVEIRDFCENRYGKGAKIRLRMVDSVPYITIKWTKQTKKGIKSREEIETCIDSLSAMMQILLVSGAKLEKSISRIREIYNIPGYKNTELIIDTLESAHGTLEYAEIECSSEEELCEILKKVFQIDMDAVSDKGITSLHKKKMRKGVSRRLSALQSLVGRD